eukprot:m.230123 g.230123  ORF g.230123 m.230123 type:complete len:92 (+) comp40056_c0_seq6:610-885(+)
MLLYSVEIWTQCKALSQFDTLIICYSQVQVPLTVISKLLGFIIKKHKAKIRIIIVDRRYCRSKQHWRRFLQRWGVMIGKENFEIVFVHVSK